MAKLINEDRRFIVEVDLRKMIDDLQEERDFYRNLLQNVLALKENEDEVIYCKDCKHNVRCFCHICLRNRGGIEERRLTFCSFGERRAE